MIVRAALLAGLVALPAAATGVPAPLAADSADRPPARFAPPPGRLILTRIVTRSLGDGAQIVVRRSFAVQFRAVADGFVLEGRQLDVTVDAPPVLGPLAEMERRRDPGILPIRFDAAGRTIDSAAAPEPGERARIAALALAIIGNHPRGPDTRDAAPALRRLTDGAGIITALPADLFVGDAGERRETRPVPLGDGSTGAIEVVTRVSAASRGREVDRTVITRVAGTTRQSREVWTLVKG